MLEKNNIKHIKLIQNLGIGGCVQTGYKYAIQNNYDIAIQFDGDGQHDITYIMELCKPIISNEADMCIGSRFLKDSKSEFRSTATRRLGKNVISLMIKLLTRKKITDPTSGFRAVNKKIIDSFAKEYPLQYPEPVSTKKILKQGYRVKEIPVNMKERLGGKSSISYLKSIDYMIKVCLSLIIGNAK